MTPFIFFRRIATPHHDVDSAYINGQLYFVRSDIEAALGYADRRSLSKMRRRYPEEWKGYIESGTLYACSEEPDEEEATLLSTGKKGAELYAVRTEKGYIPLKTLLAILSRVQRFRGPNTLLKALEEGLLDTHSATELAKSCQIDPGETNHFYDITEKQLLHNISLTLNRIEKKLCELYEKRKDV